MNHRDPSGLCTLQTPIQFVPFYFMGALVGYLGYCPAEQRTNGSYDDYVAAALPSQLFTRLGGVKYWDPALEQGYLDDIRKAELDQRIEDRKVAAIQSRPGSGLGKWDRIALGVAQRTEGMEYLPFVFWGEVALLAGFGPEALAAPVLLKIGRVAKPVLQVTDDVIRAAMKNAPLRTQQRSISVPIVQRYVDMLARGSKAPPIKVSDNVIVDGNHRYVAGRVFGTEPAQIQWMHARSQASRSWDDIFLDPVDWSRW